MLGERRKQGTKSTRPSLRLIVKLTMSAVLASGLAVAAATPQVWAQAAPSSGRSDADIQSDVAYALSNSSALKGQQITAATVEGDVTISGHVRDAASKELAESLIYRVNGVRSVTNNLTVGDAPHQPSQGQVTGGESTVQSVDPNVIAQQDPNGDLNYDPAQQNMAPAGPTENAQGAPPDRNQYPGMSQPYPPDTAQYPGQPQYSQQPQQPAAPVTIPTGTLLQVRTSQPLDATHVQPGQIFQATVATDVYQGGVLALPRGAIVAGKVLSTQTNKGDLTGKQGLSLALTSIDLGGQKYSLPTDTWSGQGPGKGGYSAANTIGTAGLGAAIGAIAGGGMGAAIGAGAGAIVGAGASAATTGPRMYIPAEAMLNFRLLAPVTVTPVSPQEAQRLAANSGYPQLQRRGAYPYAAYPYPPPPPPGYYYYPYRYPVAYYPYYYYGYRY